MKTSVCPHCKKPIIVSRAAGRPRGRPRLQVDVEAIVKARENLSLREVGKQFGIGAASVSRLEAAWRLAHVEATNCLS